MEYRPSGRSGVSVSKLCLGAMMFGPWGNPDRQESIRVIHRALDAGINVVDTADVYPGDERAVRQDEQDVALRLAVLVHKRATVVALRDAGRIDDTVLRQVQTRLDSEEVRLARREPAD